MIRSKGYYAGGEESPKRRIERLVDAGEITRDAVACAERAWRDELRSGVTLPDGRSVQIALDDVYHVIVDKRIARRPERIFAALLGVFEIRRADLGRLLCLSRWQEGLTEVFGSVIISDEGSLRSFHLIDQRRVRRYQRRYSEVIWQEKY